MTLDEARLVADLLREGRQARGADTILTLVRAVERLACQASDAEDANGGPCVACPLRHKDGCVLKTDARATDDRCRAAIRAWALEDREGEG